MSEQTETTKSGAHALSQLQNRALVMFKQDDDFVYVAPSGDPNADSLVVTGKPPQGAIDTFILTIQGPPAEPMKVLLQPLGMAGAYWVTGQNIVGLAYPIILGANPETFIITDLSPGVTIATAFNPPGSFIWGFNPKSGARVLTYGHDRPLLQGGFDFLVVG